MNRATKRVTMDFSLLSVPLCHLLQDSDSDNDKQAADQMVKGNHEENLLIQVFCLTLVSSPAETFGCSCTESSRFEIFNDSLNQSFAFSVKF